MIQAKERFRNKPRWRSIVLMKQPGLSPSLGTCESQKTYSINSLRLIIQKWRSSKPGSSAAPVGVWIIEEAIDYFRTTYYTRGFKLLSIKVELLNGAAEVDHVSDVD